MLNGSLELKSNKLYPEKPRNPARRTSAEGDRQRDYALYGAIYAQTAGGGTGTRDGTVHRHRLRTDRHSGTICPLFAQRYIVRVSDDRQLLGKEE